MKFNIEKYYLRSFSFHDLLGPQERKFVAENLVVKEYKKGQLLFKEGNLSKGIYIIKKGKVKMYKTDEEGREYILYIYKKEEYFGYRPLLGDEPHPVSVAALDNVAVSFIPKEVFITLLESSEAIARKLLINLAKEFSVLINKMTVFSQHSVKERVAISLLILSRVYNPPESKEQVISLNREDLAAFVGTAKESLVRMLRIFKDDGVIYTKGSKIVIIKPNALLNYVPNLLV